MRAPHPSRLGITPIVESNLEIRFKSALPDSAIPGMIYNALKEDYPEMEPTNVLEIPESIRSHAPELKYAPLYRLNGSKMVSVGVGANVLTIHYNRDMHGAQYPGWTSYIHDEVVSICEKIYAANIITETDRLGLRTADFFDSINIFEKSELDINFDSSSILSDVSKLEQNIIDGEFNSKVIVHSKTNRKIDNILKEGSIIDIDTSVNLEYNLLSNPDDTIMNCHKANKKIFFDLLTKEYIDTLEPRY